MRGIVNIENGVVFETVCTDLESEGYEVQPFLIPAAGVGAPHRRDRIWFIAHLANATSKGTRENDEGLRSGTSRISGRQETTVANTDGGRSHGQKHKIQTGRNVPISGSEDVADTESSSGDDDEAVAGNGGSETQEVSGDGSSVRGESAWWDFEPDVGRVAHGVPGRVYRLKALGNSIVPKIAQEIGNAIIKAEGEK